MPWFRYPRAASFSCAYARVASSNLYLADGKPVFSVSILQL